jgi:hypothetical protein
MIPDSCLEVHTSAVDRPSVPPWLAEMVIGMCQVAITAGAVCLSLARKMWLYQKTSP